MTSTISTEKRAAQFLDKLKLEDLGGKKWRVDEPMRFYSAKRSRTYKVPQGTPTDLASIPTIAYILIPFLHLLLPKSGKQNRAAVLHDAAYRGFLVDVHGYPLFVDKEIADELFLEGMLADKMNKAIAKSVYGIVKVFGRPSDKNARIADATR